LLASALLVLSVLLGACGGDDEEAADSGGEATEATTSGPLVVGAWGGAYNEATQKFYGKPYEEEGGPALRFVDAPGTQLARLQAQNRADQIQWDLLDSIAAGDAFLANAKGFLEPLPADLKSKFEEILGPEKVSDFGYTMGSLGNVIVCNMDKVDTCPKNMEEFYDPEKFPNDRMMPGFGAIYVATTAMIANGTPPSETQTTPIDLDAVFETLERIRPTVKVFWESGDQQEQVIRSGEVDMAIMWSGRAYRLIKEGVNLKVVWDGGALEPGYMAVVKGAPNKEAAFDFLEWIAEHPEQQAEWAQFLEYSVPNPEALEILPKKTAEQLVDYPANFEKIGVPNWDWYVENADELNQRYSDYLRG
jgi:putative spermidine/putrescine transport system substrate-binding protein